MKYTINERFFVEQLDSGAYGPIAVDEVATRLARQYNPLATLESKTLTIGVDGTRKWLYCFSRVIDEYEKEELQIRPAVAKEKTIRCGVCGVDVSSYDDVPAVCHACYKRAMIWVCKKAHEEL